MEVGFFKIICCCVGNSFRDEDSESNCPLPNEIKSMQWNFHMDLLRHCGEQFDESEEDDSQVDYYDCK